MVRKKKLEQKINVYDLNHVKQRLDDKIIEIITKEQGYKEKKFFSHVKLLLGLIAGACQGYAYKLTKSHIVIGLMCVVYYVSTQIIQEISNRILKNTIFLSQTLGGKHNLRVETNYVEYFSNQFKIKICLINQSNLSIFQKYSNNEKISEKIIQINKIFDKEGRLNNSGFELIILNMLKQIKQNKK